MTPIPAMYLSQGNKIEVGGNIYRALWGKGSAKFILAKLCCSHNAEAKKVLTLDPKTVVQLLSDQEAEEHKQHTGYVKT